MKLVKFSDGKFGVRKGWRKKNYQYLELNRIRERWWTVDEFHSDTRGSLVEAKKALATINDYGKTVTEEVI